MVTNTFCSIPYGRYLDQSSIEIGKDNFEKTNFVCAPTFLIGRKYNVDFQTETETREEMFAVNTNLE